MSLSWGDNSNVPLEVEQCTHQVSHHVLVEVVQTVQIVTGGLAAKVVIVAAVRIA